jgi:hypothetical protein
VAHATEPRTQQPHRLALDADTAVLYRFDEGAGDECHDATGDPALTLRAHKRALWGTAEGLGPVVRFERGANDDANVLVGPVNHDALELRRCPKAYTVEAWVRYTGPWSAEIYPDRDTAADGVVPPPRTTAQICGTDEDGFSLPQGKREGWSFSLHDGTRDPDAPHQLRPDKHLMPQARNLGSSRHDDFGQLTGIDATRGPYYSGLADMSAVSRVGIEGEGWHHIAWQWRKLDEAHWLFVDGKLVWSGRAPETRVVGPVEPNTIPFMVGGVVHSQDPPFYLGWASFEGEMASLRISSVLRLPVADELRIVPTYGHVHYNAPRANEREAEARAAARAHPASLPDAVVSASYHAAVTVEGGVADSFVLLAEGGDTANPALPRGLFFDQLGGIVHGTPVESGTASFTVVANGADGQRAQRRFTLCVTEARLATRTLPPAFGGREYCAVLDSGNLVSPVIWQAVNLPPWALLRKSLTGDADESWCLTGTPPDNVNAVTTMLTLEAQGDGGGVDKVSLALRVMGANRREFVMDPHTCALWDWQGEDGKMIPDRVSEGSDDSDALTLSWANMAGDTREDFPGWGRYPWEVGGGEWGFVTEAEAGPIADLRVCTGAHSLFFHVLCLFLSTES